MYLLTAPPTISTRTLPDPCVWLSSIPIRAGHCASSMQTPRRFPPWWLFRIAIPQIPASRPSHVQRRGRTIAGARSHYSRSHYSAGVCAREQAELKSRGFAYRTQVDSSGRNCKNRKLANKYDGIEVIGRGERIYLNLRPPGPEEVNEVLSHITEVRPLNPFC